MSKVNLRLFYNIPDIKLDKLKPFYNVNRNIIFINSTITPFNKYCVEATQDTKKELEKYLIMSNDKIDNACFKMKTDNFGRIIYKPKLFKEHFKTQYTVDSNIIFEEVDRSDDYIVFKVN